jgi:hypothetical protein
LWLANPERWHVYPYAIGPGLLAGVIVLVALGVFFWIKGKFWP